MSNKDWDPNLTPEQNYVLKQEGTESPGSSALNNEKRKYTIPLDTILLDEQGGRQKKRVQDLIKTRNNRPMRLRE